MNDADLVQRRGFRSRSFKTARDGVSVMEKSLFNSRSYHVYYENIPPKPMEITSSSHRLFTASIIFTIITLVCIPVILASHKTASDWGVVFFWGGIAAICWMALLMSRVSLLLYSQNNSGVAFFADVPSSQAVSKFIQKMFQARNAYLRGKYGQFLPDEPQANRLARLSFLRDQEVIDEAEYNFLRREQTSANLTNKGPVGFSS